MAAEGNRVIVNWLVNGRVEVNEWRNNLNPNTIAWVFLKFTLNVFSPAQKLIEFVIMNSYTSKSGEGRKGKFGNSAYRSNIFYI